MPQRTFSELLVRLHDDPAVRKRFADSPATVLREEGYDPDLLALPAKIDAAALEQQLNRIFREREPLTGDVATVAKMSPDQLWERFKVIGLNPESKAILGADDPD